MKRQQWPWLSETDDAVEATKALWAMESRKQIKKKFPKNNIFPK
jgi:hypothetical protein